MRTILKERSVAGLMKTESERSSEVAGGDLDADVHERRHHQREVEDVP